MFDLTTPFETLVLCSNTLRNVRTIVAFAGRPVLRVGKGDVPMIWLFVPSPGNLTGLVPLVQANRSYNSRVKVTFSLRGGDVTLAIDEQPVLTAQKVAEDSAIIPQLDLRPIGFNIFGDSKALNVGGNTLVGNTFVNIETMIGVGGEANAPRPT